jgi:hypothetical protein
MVAIKVDNLIVVVGNQRRIFLRHSVAAGQDDGQH